MKPILPPFGNEIVSLRLIEEGDLEATLAWRNHYEARIWFKTDSVITLEEHRLWYEQYRHKDNDFLFVIEVNSKLVGQASVYDIEWGTGRAEVGRFLAAPGERGKGYIGQACDQLVCFCTGTLGIPYLFLEVYASNEKALRLYKSCGFSEEQRYDGLIRMSYVASKADRLTSLQIET